MHWDSWAIPAATSPVKRDADTAKPYEHVRVDWHVGTDEFVVTGSPSDGKPDTEPAADGHTLTEGAPAADAGRRTGTNVVITGIRPEAERLRASKSVRAITEGLAEHLWRHPEVSVLLNGEPIDPADVAAETTHLGLDLSDVVALLGADPAASGTASGEGASPAAELIVTEWEHNVRPTVSLCRPDGTYLGPIGVRVPAPGIAYSAKVIWDGADAVKSTLLLGNLSEASSAFTSAVRDRLREFFTDRADQARALLLATWKEEGSYPYDGRPQDEAEEAERDLFDIVAVTAAPVLNGSDVAGRTFSFQLLRQALRTDGDALRRVLEQVLGLGDDDLNDLDELLTKSSLPAMIAVGKTAADRIAFCAWLRTILNDDDWVKTLTERGGLQDIIERNAWIFGDDWQTVVADRGLASGLERLRADGLSGDGTISTVRDPEGRVIRVDLLLSRAREAFGRRQHLVVELKRPSVKLRKTELDQLENYVTTVVGDPQFNDGSVDWTFLLVGRECDEYVDRKRTSVDRPSGVVDRQRLDNGATYQVIVRPWAEILREADSRLEFLSNHLPDFPDDGEVARLTQAHADLGMGPSRETAAGTR